MKLGSVVDGDPAKVETLGANVGDPAKIEPAGENVGEPVNVEPARANVGEPVNVEALDVDAGLLLNVEPKFVKVGEPVNVEPANAEAGLLLNAEPKFVNVGEPAKVEPVNADVGLPLNAEVRLEVVGDPAKVEPPNRDVVAFPSDDMLKTFELGRLNPVKLLFPKIDEPLFEKIDEPPFPNSEVVVPKVTGGVVEIGVVTVEVLVIGLETGRMKVDPPTTFDAVVPNVEELDDAVVVAWGVKLTKLNPPPGLKLKPVDAVPGEELPKNTGWSGFKGVISMPEPGTAPMKTAGTARSSRTSSGPMTLDLLALISGCSSTVVIDWGCRPSATRRWPVT